MLPFFVKVNGAIAKRLCTGLQIRLAQFDSGSRLQTKGTYREVSALFLFDRNFCLFAFKVLVQMFYMIFF